MPNSVPPTSTIPPAATPSARVPDVRLDPSGLAGTETARRRRRARQQSQAQFLLIVAALVGILVALGAFLLRPDAPPLNLQLVQTTELEPTTVQNTPSENWIVATRAGALWRVVPGANSVAATLISRDISGENAAVWADAERIFVGASDGALWAFEARDGKFAWKVRAGDSLLSRPVRWGKFVVVGNDSGFVSAFNAKNGARIWTRNVGGPVGAALAATREGVAVPLLPGGGARGGLMVLDGRTGQIRWRAPSDPRFWAPALAAPLYDEPTNRLFWGGDDGALFCLDASSGNKIWKTFAAPLADANEKNAVVLRGEPLLWKNLLVVGAEDGALRAFDAQSGKARWTAALGGAHRAAPIPLENNRLLVSTSSESALVASDGRIERRSAPALVAWNARHRLTLSREGRVFRME